MPKRRELIGSSTERRVRLREILERRNGAPMLASHALRMAGWRGVNPEAVLCGIDWPDLAEDDGMIQLVKLYKLDLDFTDHVRNPKRTGVLHGRWLAPTGISDLLGATSAR